MNQFDYFPNDVKNIIISYTGKPKKWNKKTFDILNTIIDESIFFFGPRSGQYAAKCIMRGLIYSEISYYNDLMVDVKNVTMTNVDDHRIMTYVNHPIFCKKNGYTHCSLKIL